ncbi:fibronectin-binding domain-containing protein [Marine Group I thaumarchaeote]|uniref:Fibronectin-binding domain-containing protein n=2 Tax=Marine Group I thaumarchaeote TaxID=2511932 RepID=A0A7K4M908_9ARCH|nr:fibronectin-binding domain-containing protein [Candidatus Nitrosopumilus sp. MTA1]NWJ20546.1 fibronectin-binding domain-containing protein [Marine Group I thaumarchaeote]NWJ83184.1 fibronectin-binding domain-containing protein [Marine Group I thaumarchaeote]NWK01490.1 fibronectin-binding domain-containing protein [Marine Group I thaumarchaeote]
MTLAGIELRYLVEQISEQAQDYYVSNIYGITKDSLLFKLHHTEKSDLFMMISTFGVWLTSVKIDQMESNRLLKRLRSDLLRLKLKKIKQIGSERIAYFTFEGFGKEFVLVGEFFGDGNILLCNNDMKILALQHSIDVRHRKLRVGLDYTQPPKSGLDIFNISDSDFDDLKTTDLVAGKWFGRTLGLPKKYVEGIFGNANIDSKKIGNLLTRGEIKKIFETTKKIVSDVSSGNHDAIIVRNEKTEVLPLKLGKLEGEITNVNSFIEGLDTVFTGDLVEKGKSIQSSGSDKKIKELQTQISEQEKAIETVKERSKNITNVANSLFEMVSKGTISLEDISAQETLTSHNAKLVNEKGISLIVIQDEKIKINIKASLQSIASVLFDEAKKQSGAIISIEKIKAETEKKLEKFQNKTESEQDLILVTEIRKKSWYERYRWFFTSDGFLVIGGRDAASNSAVVRKHLGKNDKIFHGDIHGSPFFILKDAKDAPDTSMNEVAHATVCFSRAWKEGMYGVSAYWVNPDQIKKSAPSGEFLPKGSFTIEGQRNFINSANLKLAVGIIPQEDDYVLTCGPPETIKKNSICYAIIEPHGSEMVDTAKKIRIEFSKIYEEITKKISLDDFVRVLPAGQSQIKETGIGDSQKEDFTDTELD